MESDKRNPLVPPAWVRRIITVNCCIAVGVAMVFFLVFWAYPGMQEAFFEAVRFLLRFPNVYPRIKDFVPSTFTWFADILAVIAIVLAIRVRRMENGNGTDQLIVNVGLVHIVAVLLLGVSAVIACLESCNDIGGRLMAEPLLRLIRLFCEMPPSFVLLMGSLLILWKHVKRYLHLCGWCVQLGLIVVSDISMLWMISIFSTLSDS